MSDLGFAFFKPFQQAPAPLATSLAGWMANPSPVPHPSASAGPMGLATSNNAGTCCSNPLKPTSLKAVFFFFNFLI